MTYIEIKSVKNLKLNIADTSSMLKGFATVSRLIDSLSALKNGLSSKLKIADTAAMLSNRFRRDTANLSDRIEANKKGINDSVLSIRSSLGIVKLAIQYVDEKNKNAQVSFLLL